MNNIKKEKNKKRPYNKCKQKSFVVSPEEHLEILKEYKNSKTKIKESDVIYLLPKNAIMIAGYRKDTDDVKIIIKGKDAYLYKKNIFRLLNRSTKIKDNV